MTTATGICPGRRYSDDQYDKADYVRRTKFPIMLVRHPNTEGYGRDAADQY
jgi:hypothetical protein